MSVLATAWTWFIGTKLGRMCLGAAAVLAALLAAWIAGHRKGRTTQATKDAAASAGDTAAAAQRVVNAAQARKQVEAETLKLPDAPAQRVAAADPATAAGKLREDGWTRD